MTDDSEDLVGKVGVIEDASSPHHGELVMVIEVNGDTLTVEPKDPKGFTFGRAFLPRRQVRIL